MALIFCKHAYAQLNKTVGCPGTLMGCKMYETLMSLFVILLVVRAGSKVLRIPTAQLLVMELWV